MLPSTISVFDITFWLIVLLIGALAFAVESGVAQRHKRLVVSSMLTSILTVIMMMFVVDDDTTFQHEIPVAAPAEEKKKKIAGFAGGLGEGDMAGLEVEGGASGNGSLPELAGADGLKPGSTISVAHALCPDCPSVVVVDRGTYFMGSRLTEAGRHISEGPIKPMTVARPFGIGVAEVTRSQYARFVSETNYKTETVCAARGDKGEPRLVTWDKPGFEQGPNHPVVCVSFEDARAYIAWLSEVSHRKYRLPSQAEWEYVARAGTTTPFVTGMEILPEAANFDGAAKGTVDVKTFPENPLKVFDMAGNAWELTEDCWTPNLELVPEDASAIGLAGDCTRRVIKGGGWDSKAEKLRAAARAVLPEKTGSPNVGFRVALALGAFKGDDGKWHLNTPDKTAATETEGSATETQ